MIDEILNAVCKHFEITREDLQIKKARRQPVKIAEAKQVATYFIWRHTKLTRHEVRNLFGYADNRIVNYSRRRIQKIAEGNREFKKQLEEIENEILKQWIRE